MGRAPQLGRGTLRHGLARPRAERHRPPELTSARPPENKRESGKTREAREVTLRVPRILPAHSPSRKERATSLPQPPWRARGAKGRAGSSPAHPESARGNVSRLQAARRGFPLPSNKPSAAGAKASPRPEGVRAAPALSPFKPPQPPPPPRYPSPDGRRSSSFRAPREVPPLGGARGGAARREGPSSGSVR